MNNYDLINKVGRVFVYGETDSLKEHLSEGCEYISEYANQKITTPKEIIERMNFVYSNLDIKSSYKFKIVPIQDILKKKNKLFKEQHNTNSSYISTLPQSYALQPPQSLRDCSPMNVGASSIKNDEYAILLYQHSDEYPVAVVSIETDSKTCKITKILLSRNSEIYNVDFYRLDMGEDSPLDLPSTVKALSPDLTYINFVNFNNCANPEDYGKDKLYIWIKSDEYHRDEVDR